MRSLLWPDGPPDGAAARQGRLGEQAFSDLELDPLVDWLSEARPDRRAAVRAAVVDLPADPATSRARAAVSADLLASPRLCDALAEASVCLRTLVRHRPEHFPREAPRAARIGARVVELQAYVDAIAALRRALAGDEVRAEGLLGLRADVAAADTAELRALAVEVPRWRRTLDTVRSVSIGINVSPALEPEAAAIVGFSDHPVAAEETALAQLLGPAAGATGLARLFRHQPVDWSAREGALSRELQALLEAVAAPVERALHAFRFVHAQAVAGLEDELVLLLGGAALGRRWRARGRPVCVAEVGRAGAACRVHDAWSPVLADRLRDPGALVYNALVFGPPGPGRGGPAEPGPGEPRPGEAGSDGASDGGAADGTRVPAGEQGGGRVDGCAPPALAGLPRIWVLTGPNRGGKTTYLRAVGVVQVLGQCGLPVPARAARVAACDRLLTHFPAPEQGGAGQGRLDEEAARMGEIFGRAGPASLVLLNEVLGGTSAPEGAALGLDILRGLRALGCRVIYATHLHELALRSEEINASLPGPSPVGSLTVAVQAPPHAGAAAVPHPTYRIVPGPPGGASHFASEIARQHGLTLPQILDGLRSRGVLPAPG